MASSRRKKISPVKITVFLIVLFVLGIGLVFGVKMLRSKVSDKYGKTNDDEVQTSEVTVGSISTTVSGSGTLANQDSDDISIPSEVEVTNIYVEAGDHVTKGDMLASVNSASVVEAMSDVQSRIDALDAELSEIEKEETSEEITSNVVGRVKKIYATENVSLASTMYDNKALMLISLDGYMAVTLQNDELSNGDAVVVTASDGTEYEGKVESVWAGATTIVLTDDGSIYGDTVNVSHDGTEIGEGTLYIHEMVSLTGYTGIAETIEVNENAEVESGDVLITVSGTDNTVNYQTILKKREKLEEELQSLIVIYKEGAVYAQADGLVTSITASDDSGSQITTSISSGMGMNMGGNSNRTSTTTTTTTTTDSSVDTVISVSPTDKMTMVVSVDESEILSISVGQAATVTVDSISDSSLAGTITAIDKVGTSSNGVTSFSATIEIDRTDDMLAGMSASAVIVIEGKEDALLVATKAVQKTSSTAYVYTSYDEESGELGGMKEVTIGLSNSSYTEITGGLSEGDVVYYVEESSSNSFGNFGGGGFSGMPGMPGGSGFGGFGGGGGSGSGSGMPSGGGFNFQGN